MILTDREIKIAVERGAITITPVPTEKAYSSTSVDLTLGSRVTSFPLPNPGLNTVINPSQTGYSYREVIKQISKIEEIDKAGYPLEPGKLVLGWTEERVGLPVLQRIAARVEGKSSLARIGLGVHITAPTIHAGFEGSIQLEMVNHGPYPILLKPGLRVCQLVFEQTLGTPERGYQGQFVDQSA